MGADVAGTSRAYAQALVPLEWLSALLLIRYAPGGVICPATVGVAATAYFALLDAGVGLAWAPIQARDDVECGRRAAHIILFLNC
jgi:hypothetical protein